jgi:tetratricopeptide (TPR) repeat protein
MAGGPKVDGRVLEGGLLAGMNAAELDACEAVLLALMKDVDLDVAGIFAALRKGHTLVAALGLPEGTVDLMYAQAIARFGAGDRAAALSLFQALSFLAPDVRDHWLGLGICGRALDQLDLARVAFETAVALAPHTAAPRFHLCEVQCQKGDWKAAAVQAKGFAEAAMAPEKASLAPEMKRLATLIEMRVG